MRARSVEESMSAHVMVDIDVHDPAGMREYLERVAGTLQAFWTRINTDHCGFSHDCVP